MLPGIVIKPLKRSADERGFFTEVMRADWKDVIQDDIVQANMSVSYPGMVRAWHRHERGQVDHFLAVRGALKICAYDDETGSWTRLYPRETIRRWSGCRGITGMGFGSLAMSLQLLSIL